MSRKDIFKKIILEQRESGFGLTPRSLRLPTNLDKAVAVYGPRRCGKTCLLRQTMAELAAAGSPPESSLYIDFEDERIAPLRKEDWELLLEAHSELFPDLAGTRIHLFLDEVQQAPSWDRFVRRMTGNPRMGIFLTGSSSKLLSAEIATALRGRTLSYFLMPFSFKEFLRFRRFEPGSHAEHAPSRHKAKRLFAEYLRFGGFPETFDKDESLKIRILQGYFDLIFYRDVVDRYKVRNLEALRSLMRHLLAAFSSPFSLGGFHNSLKSAGWKLGKDTVFEYLSYLEEANLVRMVSLFDYSAKRRLVNPRKVYCIDTGLVTAVSFQFSENKGRYLENLAFLELLRRGHSVHYYKDERGNEVDFLLADKGRPSQLIQACADLEDPKTRDRELRAIASAAERFGISEALILTEDDRDEFTAGRARVRAVPLWVWLLE